MIRLCHLCDWYRKFKSGANAKQKIRTQPSAGKVMLILFWDANGVILEHYMDRGVGVLLIQICWEITFALQSVVND